MLLLLYWFISSTETTAPKSLGFGQVGNAIKQMKEQKELLTSQNKQLIEERDALNQTNQELSREKEILTKEVDRLKVEEKKVQLHIEHLMKLKQELEEGFGGEVTIDAQSKIDEIHQQANQKE